MITLNLTEQAVSPSCNVVNLFSGYAS